MQGAKGPSRKAGEHSTQILQWNYAVFMNHHILLVVKRQLLRRPGPRLRDGTGDWAEGDRHPAARVRDAEANGHALAPGRPAPGHPARRARAAAGHDPETARASPPHLGRPTTGEAQQRAAAPRGRRGVEWRALRPDKPGGTVAR